MAKNIYVGNLPWSVSDDDLRDMFAEHGNIVSAQVIKDRHTGRSRGFGFVEMDNDEEAQKAIDALNGNDCDGRPLTVNEAKQREPREGGGGGHDRGGRDRGDRGGQGAGSGSGYRSYPGGSNRGRIY